MKKKNGSYKEGYIAGYTHFKEGKMFYGGGTMLSLYTGGFVDGYWDAKNGKENKEK